MLIRTKTLLVLAFWLVSATGYFALAGGALASESTVTVCERMISVAPSDKVSIRDLPKSIQFAVSKEQGRQYFDLASEMYKKNINFSALSSILKRLDKGSVTQLSGDDIRQLKAMRKYLMLMRNGFFLFDASHEPPAVLDRVVTDVGHLNDEIALSDNQTARKEAHDLRDEVDELADVQLDSYFKPAKLSSSEDHLDDQISVIQKYLDKNRIKARQFHEIRKIVKELMSIYLFKTPLESDAVIAASDQKVYDFLFQLNDDMGQVHDDLVAQDHRGDIDYDDYKLAVPLRIRTRIIALLNRIDS
jgi:hypothetical protein